MGNCKNCKWYDEKSGCEGMCLRHSPVARLLVTMDEYKLPNAVWPKVYDENGCGDFDTLQQPSPLIEVESTTTSDTVEYSTSSTTVDSGASGGHVRLVYVPRDPYKNEPRYVPFYIKSPTEGQEE